MPTVLELFAGAGGLALGLDKAGFTNLACIENNNNAVKTLRKNTFWNVIEADVKTVDFTQFSPDLVSGGCPCQPFSLKGKRQGFEDPRGRVFFEFLRCLRETNPYAFLFENVKGLVIHDKGKTFEFIKECFEDLGYNLKYNVLNAMYYQVPQKRERLFIIGVRGENNFTFPEKSSQIITLREALRDAPPSPFNPYSESKKKVMELVPEGGCWVDLPVNVAKEYMGKAWYTTGGKRGIARRLSYDKPCLTLTTSPAQKQTELCHPEFTRPLSVREYARIQTFPDNWDFCGSVAEQYKQIGNAVPVKLAQKIGEQLLKIF